MAEWSEEPVATLDPFECDECDNDIEGICSVCGAYVCGSCFNGNHEYKVHGQALRREWAKPESERRSRGQGGSDE